jgi:HEAT repeat protein
MLWWTLRQLKADDWQTRESAAKKLADLNDLQSIEPLVIALHDKNSHVRQAVEGALVKIGTPAIKALVTALKDRNSDVRHTAQSALIRIGNPAVLSLGLALYDGDLEAREAAAAALGKIGGETSVEQRGYSWVTCQ